MNTVKKFAIASVSLWALAAPGMVMAEEAEDGVNDNRGITVMARRREENAQDIPVVVQAVTAQALNELNIREFEDIETLVPGLSMDENANGIGTTTTLRGIAFDVNASGNNGTVEFYFNDAPISAGVLFQSLFDVGQIEVLRGPQGTLRGRASPSGSITVTTRKPDLSQAGGYAQGTVNDIGGWNLNAAVNVPIVQDILAIRVAGLAAEGDGDEVRSINSSANPSTENKAIRISVMAEPVEALTLFGSYTRTNRRFTQFTHLESLNIADPDAPASPVLIRAKDRLATQAIPPRFRQDFEILNWQADLRLFGQQLSYVGSRTKQSLRSQGRGDSGGVFAMAFPDTVALHEYGQFSATDSTVKSHEVRLSNQDRIAGLIDYTIGYFTQASDVDTNLLTPFPLFVALGPVVPDDLLFLSVISPTVFRPSGSRESSIFGHIKIHITDSTELAGGARRIKYKNRAGLFVNGGEVPAGRVTFDTSQRSAWIYSASLSHRFSPEFLAYASFGTSWRPGGDTNAIILRDVAMPSPVLASLFFPDNEESKSYEIGIKTDLFDRRLRFNLTGYYQKFKNYAFFARDVFFGGPNAQGTNSVFNAVGIAVGVPATVKGVEAEIAFQATPNWNIGAVLAYSKSKTSATIPCNDYFPNDGIPDSVSTVPTFAQLNAASNGDGVTFCDVTQRAGLTPPFTATVQTEYSRPVSGSMEGYVRGLMTYAGNSKNDPTNPIDDIKSHAIVNLFAGIRHEQGNWELGVYAKNIFNTFRITQRSSTPTTTSFRTFPTFASGNAVSTYRGVSVTAPQEFGMTFRVSFGSR